MLENGVDKDHIIEIALDGIEYEELRDPKKCFQYIKKNLVDVKNGEWDWSILEDGQINKKEDKAGFWKCPYHNGRMCMEIIERF